MNEIARPAAIGPVFTGSQFTGSKGAAPRGKGRGRSGLFGVLDIGTSKVTCLVLRTESDGGIRVIGMGHQRSAGLRAGAVVELEAAEAALRATVAQAEDMADTRLDAVTVNLSCGKPHSTILDLAVQIPARAVTEADLRHLQAEAGARARQPEREVVHVVRLGYALDGAAGVRDPRGMHAAELAAKLHVVDAAQGALRTLQTCLGRCDLAIEQLVVAPFAAGIAALVEDERELGVTVVDMGAGVTSIAVFAEGRLVHADLIPVGGQHVTNDIARGLSTPLAHAERMKTLYGSAQASPDDDRENLAVPLIGEDEHQIAKVPRSMLVGIIRPRLEETFELVRSRLEDAQLGRIAGRRVVLTGGASQLVGVRELAAHVLDKQVRHGRPQTVRGLPEAATSPAFAVAAGLALYAAERGAQADDIAPALDEAPRGGLRRLAAWLRSAW
ncbi:MAG: cell division protein FtsA [Alphaproteobacteria bacterium]|nr:cell division protein FtsA [Alphaproteobacteria bacterium]